MLKKEWVHIMVLLTGNGYLTKIAEKAAEVHSAVNQFYGDKPYSYHLGCVAKEVIEHGYLVCDEPSEILGMVAGAYFHDSIEDARLTYNDVFEILKEIGLSDSQAILGAEIAYALTNEKGRTRKERANDKYYAGIVATKYAPFVKCADRIANLHNSIFEMKNIKKAKMYIKEMPHFLESICKSNIKEYSVPRKMVSYINEMIENYVDN